MAITPPDRCSYERLEGNIHAFVLHESSRAAVDTLVGYVYDIVNNATDGQAARYLIDHTQSAAVPLKYLVGRIREVNKSRPAEVEPGKIAILYEGVVGEFANVMLRGVMTNRFRFFKPSDRETAITWLQSN